MRKFLLRQNLLATEMTRKEYEELSGLDLKGSGRTKGICWKVEGSDELNWIPVKEFTALDVSDEQKVLAIQINDLKEKIQELKDYIKSSEFIDLSPKKKESYQHELLTLDRYVSILEKRH